ncbi:MarR family winged helix-turn-helix transcriptional regulator [Amycolatopsis benzoatilytica]|uniref:MarR family winged helix-turn-helix transcriptional regulator n=1 Tax=Amycolatopsis benzoatilytica TaxID=346045 RepID=UPI000372D96D|nr:MarR family winged helix-turn-helix transcriptional regulator [Amycolatopsis benzoatilytica]
MDKDALAELFASAALGAPENAVGFVMWRVVHRYVREIDQALAPLDLTHLQFQTLALAGWLNRTGGPVTQSGLAAAGDVHPIQVSQLLKTLEGKGFVARARRTEGDRANRVEVTNAGAAVLRAAMPLAVEVQHRIFGDEGLPGSTLLNTLLRLDNA